MTSTSAGWLVEQKNRTEAQTQSVVDRSGFIASYSRTRTHSSLVLSLYGSHRGRSLLPTISLALLAYVCNDYYIVIGVIIAITRSPRHKCVVRRTVVVALLQQKQAARKKITHASSFNRCLLLCGVDIVGLLGWLRFRW